MTGLYLYDGGFQGLLTVLRVLRETGAEPADIRADASALQASLLDDEVRVKTDAARAERFSREVCERISPGALRRAFRAFLSEEDGAEYAIYRYLRLGWEVGDSVDAHVGDEYVHAVRGMSRRTGHEAHRMQGLLRFRQLQGGLFYAPMRTRCDVLCLVARHFLGRMGDQDWMIHDLGREQAALCSGGELGFVSLPEFDPLLSEGELTCQEMWRDYFRNIAVRERRNPRLQRSLMPMRYWHLLVEEPGVSP
ncbi:MAG: TIGR03915 family putative DNA repair protein [Actinomycetota bacterium]|nr:TIGR03915 family putative DNA repair protein [Actinomycetota bacterium]MDD5668313.1 TIGR03915 family putative DNA repair protein [Actinomycetota bacterium]